MKTQKLPALKLKVANRRGSPQGRTTVTAEGPVRTNNIGRVKLTQHGQVIRSYRDAR